MTVKGLSDWLNSAAGDYVFAWELERYDAMVGDIFGYNALQIGLPGHDFLRNSRITHHFSLSPDDATASMRATPFALPIASSSIDLVILPHVLEFSRYPHRVLREVERVLMPDGSVIVSAFNPFSLFGLRRLVAGPGASEPWRGQYFSLFRLRDWLTLLGFETEPAHFGCFAPPVQSRPWIERWSRLDRAGHRLWPICGGVYMLHGIKRVHGMRMIAPKWRSAAEQRKGLVSATRRAGKVPAHHSSTHTEEKT